MVDKDEYAVGATLMAMWMKQKEMSCVVVDKRTLEDGRVKYYVHWHDYNRRMDEWIDPEDIIRQGTDQEKRDLEKKEAREKSAESSKKAGRKEAAAAAASTTGQGSGAVTHEDGAIPASGGQKRTRSNKRKAPEDHEIGSTNEEEHDEHEGMDAASIREHEEITKVKNVRFVEFGRFRMAAWYFSPFPKEYYPNGFVDCLYFCEFCMAFFCHKVELLFHQQKHTTDRHPPGNEIYRHENISVFEVDGTISKVYCQNLCYLAKLFLDHKTLYYDVDPFLFYMVCEVDAQGFHPVGYFSKEKYSELGYNLACILTFPCHQRKGYGNFIIEFSYELSKKEEKVGSPEKPLSDLGLVSYRSYWIRVLLKILQEYPDRNVSIMDLTRMTSIKTEDVISTLQHLNMIKYLNGQYVFVVPNGVVETYLSKHKVRGPQVVTEKLHWAPLHLDIKRDKWSLKAKSQTQEE